MYLIKEWVGDAYLESGVYESVDQFIKDIIKNIEDDGTKVTKKIINGTEIIINVTFDNNYKGYYKYIVIPIELNKIIN